MRIAILQSAFLPWKGYFDIIGSVDTFVIYDDVQYSKNHWHNRNLIKTQHGLKWLTVPVAKSAGGFRTIEETKLARPFSNKHWQAISQSYAKAPFFHTYSERLELLYRGAEAAQSLSELNARFLALLCSLLNITTRIVRSSSMKASGTRTGRLLNICEELGATQYLSGPSAKSYLDQSLFSARDISVKWMDYSSYPEYPQLHGQFEHSVSVIDLLFNTGPKAPEFLMGRMTGQ